jgi:DNA-binding response OmpR family regulator
LNSRILVIDDETNIRTMIKLALEHVGYAVETAADGKEGLEKFGDGSGYNLVLLDQRMPGMPGIEVLAAIKKINPGARLILITAFGTIDLALEAMHTGASDFLRKPFTAETLRSSVSAAIEKPCQTMTAVPVKLACREFYRANINGFGFEMDHAGEDDETSDYVCTFKVTRSTSFVSMVAVALPNYVKELVLAYTDTESVPGGARFWQAMCEEALANYLWQNANTPPEGRLRIEDLSSSLQRWLDSVLTISLAD